MSQSKIVAGLKFKSKLNEQERDAQWFEQFVSALKGSSSNLKTFREHSTGAYLSIDAAGEALPGEPREPY